MKLEDFLFAQEGDGSHWGCLEFRRFCISKTFFTRLCSDSPLHPCSFTDSSTFCRGAAVLEILDQVKIRM